MNVLSYALLTENYRKIIRMSSIITIPIIFIKRVIFKPEMKNIIEL